LLADLISSEIHSPFKLPASTMPTLKQPAAMIAISSPPKREAAKLIAADCMTVSMDRANRMPTAAIASG
jgi:hypothetical protein